MDYRKIILYLALAAVLMALWAAWQKDYPPQAPTATNGANINAIPAANVPSINLNNQQATAAPPSAITTVKVSSKSTSKGNLITVTTDVLSVSIDTHGGNIVQADLLKYPEAIKSATPVRLFNQDPDKLYAAQSGLIGPLGPDTESGQAVYTSAQSQYALDAGQQKIVVPLTWRSPEGVQITKIFTFTRNKYVINVAYQVNNKSKEAWSGQLYGQIKRHPQSTSSSIFSLHTYNGAALSSPEESYEKITYSKMENENLNRTVTGGWLAIQERYFLSAWIPGQSQTNRYYSNVNDSAYTLGYVGPVLTVQSGETATTAAKLYVGPEIADNLKVLAPHLDLTIDYGWLWPISIAIFWVMQEIHRFVGNWGWSIVLVTLLIKLIFYKLSETSYRSMAKMRLLAPRLQALKERYGDDRQKMSQATMELYRKEKVNPLGGCLPILVQIPFFIALYYVLIESVQLRQAPFIFWLHDLSVKDPYYVLPILMGITMFIQQRLNPAPPDPMQARMMMLLPVVFTVFFLAFPAGLTLYWLVNNILSVAQQWFIMRRFEKHEKKIKKA